MHIDAGAVLVAKKEIMINAPIARVWSIQANLEEWPLWQPNVTSVEVFGSVKKGTRFVWKAMGMSIVSELQVVNKPKEIGWTGTSLGMSAVHTWRLISVGKKTRVVTEESLSGWFPKLLKIVSPNFLETSLTTALKVLKAEAEKPKK